MLTLKLRWLCDSMLLALNRLIGDTFGISAMTVCNTIWRVTDALVGLADDFIRFPRGQEAQEQKQAFYEIGGFPDVLGCIDGTHIRIMQPGIDDFPVRFFNRKHYYSTNCQAVCDSNYRFTDIVARFLGSCHDSSILKSSTIYTDFENGQKGDGIILGDSGYPLKRWLLTPFLNPSTESQERYTTAQIKTRTTVERSFGQLKRRFGLLHKELRVKPGRATKLFVACAVLHNIAKDFNLPDVFQEVILPNPEAPQPELIPNAEEAASGRAMRDLIVQNYFR